MRTNENLWRVFITGIAAIFAVCFGGATIARATIAPCTDNFFDVSAPIAVSQGARSIAFDDFNGDGIQDLITPSNQAGVGKINVRLGNGTSYGPEISTNVGLNPFVVATADFNLDGKPDFAVTNQADGSVSVGYGVGDGTFASIATLVTGAFYAEGLDAGDFNKDGRPDLAVAVRGIGAGDPPVDQSMLKIYFNSAAGFVGSPLDRNVGPEPVWVRAADLDHDGLLDLIVGNETPDPGTGKIRLLYGNGSGVGAAAAFSVGDYAVSIAVGDLNRDGYNDIATANFYGNSMTVLLAMTGADAGNYARTDHDLGSSAGSITIGDINQDGVGDLAVTVSSGSARIFLGDGDGTFTEDTSVLIGSQPLALELTDANLDGRPDLVTTFLSQVSILENTCQQYTGGKTGLTAGTEYLRPDVKSLCTEVVESRDRTNFAYQIKSSLDTSLCTVSDTGIQVDLKPDTVGDDSERTIMTGGITGAVSIDSTSTTTRVSGMMASRVAAAASLTGDSNLELIYYKDVSGSLIQKASTVLNAAAAAESEATGAITATDFDRDGFLDFLVADFDLNKVHIETILNPDSATPTFTSRPKISVGLKPVAIATGDFNQDGKQDFVTANEGDNTLSVYQNSASTTSTPIPLPSTPTDVKTADMNLDGNLDLVVGTETGIKLLYGSVSGSFSAIQSVATDEQNVLKVALGDINLDGKIDMAALTKTAAAAKSVETVITKLDFAGALLQSIRGAKVSAAGDTRAVGVKRFTSDAQADLLLAKKGEGKVSIIKGTVNTAPIGTADQYDVDFEGLLQVPAMDGVLGNDSDPEGADITAQLISGPAVGEVTLSPDGSFDYQSEAPYSASVTFTYKVFDGARESEPVTVTIDINDITPPVITKSVTGTVGNNGWYTTDVNIDWSVSDPESGVSGQVGCVDTLINYDTGNVTFYCSASSGGGNSSDSVTVKRDATMPTLAPSVSPNPVLLGGSATASANAADAMSGIASQSCDLPNTSTVGFKSLSCSATDNAGNSSNANASYQVIFNFSGFFDPVENLPMVNVVKGGQIVPIRFGLAGYQGMGIISAGFPIVSEIGCDASAPSSTVEEASGPGSSALSYDLATDRYQYNWKTKKGDKGCRMLVFQLVDGTLHMAKFQFK